MKKALRFRNLLAFVVLIAATLIVASLGSKATGSDINTTSILVEYPISSSPKRLAVESPGRVWFTLPDQNAIGHLVVTSTMDYEVFTYTVPTSNSNPYDLIYTEDVVWFTEKSGNQIGRFDPVTGNIDEFSIETTNSAPTGIDVAPNGQVWFVERDANSLARLTVTSTVDYAIDEFAVAWPSGQLESVDTQDDDNIWFTAPGIDRLILFQPSKNTFYDFPTGGGYTPWDVVIASAWPWISAYDADLIGRYSPQTQGDYTWFSIGSGSGPMGIDFDTEGGVNRTWFVARDSGQVGKLDTDASQGTRIRLMKFSLPSPNSQPEDIAVDSNDHAWIAETGANKIAEWRPPYVRFVYLPLVLRQ